MILDGVEPVQMHDGVPATLQEAKPKAGTIRKAQWPAPCWLGALGHGPQTGAKPRSQSNLTLIRRRMSALMFLLCRRYDRPDENQSGRGDWTNRHVGPADQKWPATRGGSKPAKGRALRMQGLEPQERRRTNRGKDHSSGQAAKVRRR
jgi:hypothetical protein